MSTEATTSGTGAAKWDELPDMLAPAHLRALLGAKSSKTIGNLVATGQLPKPVIRSGNFLRWRKEDVRLHLDRRSRM